jgi:hypothetical protein
MPIEERPLRQKGHEVMVGGLRCLLVYYDEYSHSWHLSPLGGGANLYRISKEMLIQAARPVEERSLAHELTPA